MRRWFLMVQLRVVGDDLGGGDESWGGGVVQELDVKVLGTWTRDL